MTYDEYLVKIGYHRDTELDSLDFDYLSCKDFCKKFAEDIFLYIRIPDDYFADDFYLSKGSYKLKIVDREFVNENFLNNLNVAIIYVKNDFEQMIKECK